MRKTLLKVTLCGAALLAAFGTAGIGTASAAATNTAASDSTVSTTPGSLTIQSAPSIAFNSTPINDFAPMTSTSSSALTGLDTDDPGLTSGYTVSVAQTTPFTDSGLQLKNATITLNSTGGSFTSSTNGTSDPTIAPSVAISSTGSQVESAGSATTANPVGVGAYSYAGGSASLSIGNDQTVLAGTYTSDLTWTIAANPTTTTTPAA